MRSWIVILAFVLFPLPLLAQESEAEVAIKKLLLESYVEGVHAHRDAAAVKRGFHPDFMMHVFHDGSVIQAPLAMWLDRMQLDGTKNPKKIDHSFDLIDVTGHSAVVKMQIYADSEHLYTDYFGLYKTGDGWRIVNKIFYGHD